MQQSDNYNTILKIWENFSKKETDIRHPQQLQWELELHKKLLYFLQAGESYIYIFNVSTAEFEFISPSIEKVLGYRNTEITLELFFKSFHPDDQVWYINSENEVGKFLYRLPREKMFNYKVRMDYRMQKRDGHYTRLLHQVMVIQQNEDGSILRTLGVHTDISHLKLSGRPSLSFIGLEGEPSFIDVKIGKPLIPVKEMLSKREKEILLLLAAGKQNKEIAEALSISKQTVDKHRKNMITRNNFNTSVELIATAIKNGWI